MCKFQKDRNSIKNNSKICKRPPQCRSYEDLIMSGQVECEVSFPVCKLVFLDNHYC